MLGSRRHLAAHLVPQRRFAEADALLRRALEVDPDDLGALKNLSVVEPARGDLEQAIRLATRVASRRRTCSAWPLSSTTGACWRAASPAERARQRIEEIERERAAARRSQHPE